MGAFDDVIDEWPRPDIRRPPNQETELVFRLWEVLHAARVSENKAAKVITEIFIHLGTIPRPDDVDKYAQSMRQRLRNARTL